MENSLSNGKRISIFLVFLLFLAPGCGGMDLSLDADYFPAQLGDHHDLLRTNAQGLQEDFTDTIEDTSEVGGTPVFVFNTRDPQGNLVRTDFYGTQSSDGVRFCGWDDLVNDFSARYFPCIFFPYLMAGEDHSGTVQVEGGGNLADAVSLDYVMTQTDVGSVTVPAGTFDVWRYTVRGGDEDPTSVTHFSFARRRPGPPVLMVTETGGETTLRMVLIEDSRGG